MTADPTRLPDGFAALDPFVDHWAVEGSANRGRQRDISSADQRAAFYAAANPRLEEALAYLDGKPLAALNERDQRLLNLMLSLAHVALAVEMQADDEPVHQKHRQHMHITRTPADVGVPG